MDRVEDGSEMGRVAGSVAFGRRHMLLAMLAGIACPAVALAGGRVGSGRSYAVAPRRSDRRTDGLRDDQVTGLQGRAAVPASLPAQVGNVRSAIGSVFARLSDARPLSAGAAVLPGDLVWTNAASRAVLAMAGGSHVFLGANSRVKVEHFLETGGRLVLGEGTLVIDRDRSLPQTDIEVHSAFGSVGTSAQAGSRFFVGWNRGAFAVFCERGEVEVRAGGRNCILKPGDGVDIPKPGEAPGKVSPWDRGRIDEAFASVLG